MDFKQLIFVSGKGGTGKTTIALLMAKHLASKGKKVLCVELANRSSMKHLAHLSIEPEYKPQASAFGFDISLLQGADCLIDYIGSFTKVERLARQFIDNSIIRTLLNVAPGLNDLAILGKLTSSMRGHGPSFQYDHIVVDAHSTGSFMSLLRAPSLLGRSVSSGPLHSQSKGIEKVLRDKNLVQYFFVSLFEQLPVDELEETLEAFEKDFGEQITVLMNRQIDLIQATLPDEKWRVFLETQLLEQTLQAKRVAQLWHRNGSVPLLPEKLDHYMNNYQGDILRDTLRA